MRRRCAWFPRAAQRARTRGSHRNLRPRVRPGRALRSGGVESDGNGTLSAELPWAVAETDVNDLTPGVPLRVRFQSTKDSQATPEGSAYQLIY